MLQNTAGPFIFLTSFSSNDVMFLPQLVGLEVGLKKKLSMILEIDRAGDLLNENRK